MTSPPPGSVDIALSRRSHERIGERRTDDRWLEEVWGDPATRVLVLAGSRFPVIDEDGTTSVAWQEPGRAPEGLRVLLGEQGGTVRFAVLTAEAEATPGGEGTEDEGTEDGRTRWVTLREVGTQLGAADAGLVVHAVALAEWHRSHRFCPRCGGSLEPSSGGHVLTCTRCGRHQFPRTDPAVIMLVTDGDRALLGRQPSWPPGRYSTLAGFVEPGESLEDAVRREVLEEVGVEVGDVAYVGNQPWPFPGSLMVGFFAHATSTAIVVDGEEIEDARWFTREEVAAAAREGTVVLPGGFSISRSLVEAWYGEPLPGSW